MIVPTVLPIDVDVDGVVVGMIIWIVVGVVVGYGGVEGVVVGVVVGVLVDVGDDNCLVGAMLGYDGECECVGKPAYLGQTLQNIETNQASF